MLDLKLLTNLLFPDLPKFPSSRTASSDELLPDGLTMGTLYIGRQGTGKTSSLARHLVDYFKAYPQRAIFVLDWSGSITDNILSLILQEPRESFEELVQRIVYDDLGNPEWVVPLPEFSDLYGTSFEEQAQRLSIDLQHLAPELVKDAPFLAGLGLKEIAPQLFRLISAITTDNNETWQITEAKTLLTNIPLLRRMVAKYGHKVGSTKEYFEREFLPLSQREKELRTYAVRGLLGAIESPEIKARLGYPRPGWSPEEVIRYGQLFLGDGARLINRESTQHYLFTRIYSLIMSAINKRRPTDPRDLPVSLVLDEVYSLLRIPGMAPEISQLSPQYRSRKLQLYVVLQELAQMSEELRPHIWSLGNLVSFAISNFNEAYEIAQQIFKYDPKTIKLGAKSDTGQPVVEPDRGQYLQIANDIQRMNHRECVIRRFASEKAPERYVLWVKKTKDVPTKPTEISVDELKDRLLKQRAVRVKDALETISQRTVVKKSNAGPPQI